MLRRQGSSVLDVGGKPQGNIPGKNPWNQVRTVDSIHREPHYHTVIGFVRMRKDPSKSLMGSGIPP